MDDGSAFCERCGLDSDRLGSAGASEFRVCPDCSSSTCANCWNQVAGRCLACSPFHLATTAPAATRRIAATFATQRPLVPPSAKPTADAGASPRGSLAARAITAKSGVAAGAGRLARRGLGKAARVSLVVVVAVVAVVGVRAVTFTSGAVAAQDAVDAETLAPEFPVASATIIGAPQTSAPAALQDPSELPAERHHDSGTSSSSNGGGSSGGGGGNNGGNGGNDPTPGVTPSAGPTATPGPGGTPTPTPGPTATPDPTPTDTPTPTDAPTDPPPPPTDTPAPPPTDTPDPSTP